MSVGAMSSNSLNFRFLKKGSDRFVGTCWPLEVQNVILVTAINTAQCLPHRHSINTIKRNE